MYKDIQNNYDIMTMTLPDDKKDFVKKEVKAVTEKLVCVGKFEEKVKKIESFVSNLKEFDGSLKTIDQWMTAATTQLKDIKESRDKMTPEDRVSYTMELQEDIAGKVKIIQGDIEKEKGLLPQGNYFIWRKSKNSFICCIFKFQETRCLRMLRTSRMS